MNKALLFLIGMASAISGFGQHKCGTDRLKEKLFSRQPELRQNIQAMDQSWSEHVQRMQRMQNKPVIEDTDTIYEIPVVVHVLHPGEPIGSQHNPSDAAIQDWIEFTNQIFEGTAAGCLPVEDGGTRIPIRLVLAKRDPNCMPTNGINRIDMSSNANYVDHGVSLDIEGGIELEDVLQTSRWDPYTYYNVYVINRIDGENGFEIPENPFTVGFASFPSNSLTYDAAFMLAFVVNTWDATFAHEMGHALGLYHTFEGGDEDLCPPAETNCSTEGDLVCDTEVHAYYWTCPTNAEINPCTGTYYQGTQYNIMSYGICQNRFTPGQRDRAIYMLKTYRQSLINSNGLNDPAHADYTIPVDALCTPSTIYPTYNMGPANVQIGNMFHKGFGALVDGSYYIDHVTDCQLSPKVAEVQLGAILPIYVTVQSYEQILKVYIDFNNDGSFDEISELVCFQYIDSSAPFVDEITMPSVSPFVDVPLRVRVMTDYYTNLGISACDPLLYGQAEDFALILRAGPLASQLLSFEAKADACTTNISWSVAHNDEVQHYLLQHSTDGQQYNTIATILPSETQGSYTLTDDNAPHGKNFYRLAIVNNQNNIVYSETKSVEIKCDNAFIVHPNPTTHQFFVDYVSNIRTNAELKIVDMMGRIIYTQQLAVERGANTYDIDASTWADGAYIIELNVGTTQYKSTLIKK